MPHISAVFLEDGGEGLFEFIRKEKTRIREALAAATGYDLQEIAFIPNILPIWHRQFSDNMLPLELVVDAGNKCLGNEEKVVEVFLAELLKIHQFQPLNFGIWFRSFSNNSYYEHNKPPS